MRWVGSKSVLSAGELLGLWGVMDCGLELEESDIVNG